MRSLNRKIKTQMYVCVWVDQGGEETWRFWEGKEEVGRNVESTACSRYSVTHRLTVSYMLLVICTRKCAD